MPTLIYSLICPLTDEVRYIGKTHQGLDRRLNAHIRAAKRRTGKGGTRKDLWLSKILRLGHLPKMVVIAQVADGEHWSEAERRAIDEARKDGARLTNMTLGGEGSSFVTDDKRAKLSAAAKRRVTPEYRAMMAAKSRAAWSDPDKRKRIVSGITDEVRLKVSAASKRLWDDPDKAARSRANLTSDETKRKLMEVRRSDAYRRKQSATRSTPEYKERASRSQLLAWDRRRGANA